MILCRNKNFCSSRKSRWRKFVILWKIWKSKSFSLFFAKVNVIMFNPTVVAASYENTISLFAKSKNKSWTYQRNREERERNLSESKINIGTFFFKYATMFHVKSNCRSSFFARKKHNLIICSKHST